MCYWGLARAVTVWGRPWVVPPTGSDPRRVLDLVQPRNHFRVVPVRLRIDADGAFDQLVRISTQTNLKLRDVPRRLVDDRSKPE
jgi:hypothetical protein